MIYVRFGSISFGIYCFGYITLGKRIKNRTEMFIMMSGEGQGYRMIDKGLQPYQQSFIS